MSKHSGLRQRARFSGARWSSYLAAATATAITGAHSAQGEIHFSGPVNFDFRGLHDNTLTHRFPLSNGAELVGVRDASRLGVSSATFLVQGAAVSNNLRVVKNTTYGSSPAAALPRGTKISHGDFGYNFDPAIGRMQAYACIFPGWQEAGTYYIGFRFDTGAGKQYGWVRIKWYGCADGFALHNEYTVKDYAWGDPGDQIKAGQRTLPGAAAQVAPRARSAVPAPAADAQGSLGLLALGAIGLQAWRNSRQDRASANADAP